MTTLLYHVKWLTVGLAVALFATGLGAFIVQALGGQPSL